MKWKMLSLGALLVLGAGVRAWGMERWAALAQLESGNNDHALGAAGEISRYQIKPRVWHRYAPASANWRNAEQSLPIAQAAMHDRCANFQKTFRRPPTDFEFYVLWNAPAQIRKPSPTVAKRARRFCNLLKSEPEAAAVKDSLVPSATEQQPVLPRVSPDPEVKISLK